MKDGRNNEERKDVLMKNFKFLCMVLLLGVILFTRPLHAQQPDSTQNVIESAPRVFIDCNRCDIDYIRTEINYVNYVWDRKNADVHVLITRQGTGGGGREYALAFLGLGKYQSMTDTLGFHTDQNMTDDEVRARLVKILQIGLLPYVAKTPMRDQITLNVGSETETTEATDRWNYWVFSMDLSTDFRGEQSQEEADIFSRLEAERITKDLKLNFNADGRFNEENFTYTDEETGEEVNTRSLRKSWEFSGGVVPSLTQHWSIASNLEVNSSTYRNIQRAYTIGAGIEYNIFPYADYTYREFRLQYRIGYLYNNYYNETIYDKMAEGHVRNSLLAIITFTQPWGEARATLEASAFVQDFNKNRLELDADLEIRLFKGFSLDLNGNYSIINDQIQLEKGDLTPEEVLLRQRELATGFEYNMRIGLSYAFGSIYNNIVNPRFEDRRHFR